MLDIVNTQAFPIVFFFSFFSSFSVPLRNGVKLTSGLLFPGAPLCVEGDQCDRCKAQAYGYDSLIGCQSCNCHPYGVYDGNMDCRQTGGRCDENVGGRRCDTCIPGHWNFPRCDTRVGIELIHVSW